MSYENDDDALIREGLNDSQLRGLFRNGRGEWMFDLRYTDDAINKSPILSPRTADMNIVGDYAVPVSADIVTELGLDN